MFVVQMVSYHGYAQEIVGPFASHAEASAWTGSQPQARIGEIKELVGPADKRYVEAGVSELLSGYFADVRAHAESQLRPKGEL